MSEPIVHTRAGALRGRSADGVDRFLGIPYAAAPFGDLRFAAPAPAPDWEGVRDALDFGATAPKVPYPSPLSDLLADVTIAGDECLNLNVWAPARHDVSAGATAGASPDASARPVMVWIHGGSLRNGSSSQAVYDGAAFARDGVVLVSVNYRLGVEGFGVFADAPHNRGLRDVVAALEWVRDEIAAFGGDPGNVTVFGQSAGANIVSALLVSPMARGLFRRAVLQSGPPTLQPRAAAEKTITAIAKILGVAPAAAAFAAADRAALLAAQAEVTRAGDPISGAKGFGIVADPETVPVAPLDGIHRGDAAGIDLLLGSTTQEHRLWFVPGKTNERITPLVFALARLKFRVPRAAARAYRGNRVGEPLGEVLGAIATDLLIRLPLQQIADEQAATTYVYEFAWETPLLGLGSCHALEIGFVFDTLDTDEARALAGAAAPQGLADRMHAAWVGFATAGDPGWPAWDASRPVRVFDEPDAGVVRAPRDDERTAWGRRRFGR